MLKIPPPPAESQPKGFCFHILSDSLLDSTLKKLSKLEQELSLTFPCKIFTYFLSNAEFKECPQWSNHTNHLAYFRIKLASVLPYEIKRCLYLDIDMLVLKDLRELFALPLGDNIAGVVLDCSNPYKEKRLKARDSTQEDFIFPFRKEYFNSGFMLINLTKWRELQIEYKCMKFLQTYIPQVGDQDILNAVIGNKTLKLPPKWNFFINHFNAKRLGRVDDFCADESKNCLYGYTSQEYQKSLKDIRIIHFTFLGAKTWENECKLLDSAYLPLKYPYYEDWWQVALQTPIFKEELANLHQQLKEKEMQDYAKALGNKLTARDRFIQQSFKICDDKMKELDSTIKEINQELQNQKLIFGAKKRIQNHLSFKIGLALQTKSAFKRLLLPFTLLMIFIRHKRELNFYQKIININPNLKLPPLEEYCDLNEALECKKQYTYQLGEKFLNFFKKMQNLT
ncbi:glycosyltransferase family 8 protein [Helicobacter rodentium]|uniref:glycosyltransferase family 8 protein n=3 Tax=Helicobacter rodentium TaxID=59617 RepID=UPI0033A51204